MRLAFFGDVVGRAGRKAVTTHLPRLRADLGLDAVVINAENAAGGLALPKLRRRNYLTRAQMCSPLAIIALTKLKALV